MSMKELWGKLGRAGIKLTKSSGATNLTTVTVALFFSDLHPRLIGNACLWRRFCNTPLLHILG